VIHLEIKKLNKRYVSFVFLIFITLIFGYYSHYPSSLTHDPAIHGEIIRIIENQGYPNSWEPYVRNDFTYPPLFHYLSFLIYSLGFDLIDSVRILGILIWVLFPICIYFLASTFRKDIALLSAVIIAFLPAFTNIAMFGEFPQLLAMEFIVLQIYFFRKKKYFSASLLTGLTIVTHPFMSIISILIYVYFFGSKFLEIKNKKPVINRKAIIYVLIPLFISSFWIPKYFEIMTNMISGDWHNVIYNVEQPYFWFWSFEDLAKYFFDLNYLTPIIIPLALFGLIKTKDRFLRIFFLTCLIFSIYHLPYTQLKIFDLLTIPSAILAALGAKEIGKYFKKYWIFPVLIVVILMGCFQIYHLLYAKTNWLDPSVGPTYPLYKASVWLKGYDGNFTKIYAEQAPAWVGILSNKIPMNPEITDLEKYSPNYLKQLENRKKIKENLENNKTITNLAKDAGIKYVIMRNQVEYLKEIYSDLGWFIYEV
jgi:hypothetical protein